MPEKPNVLERRASMLAGRLTARKETIRNAFAPPGMRPPFTEQLTKREAMDFWRQHRYDQTGADVLARMSDIDIAELDAALASVGVMPSGARSMPY